MMKFSELFKFLKRHYKQDTKKQFACRLARFGLLSLPMIVAETRARKLRNNGYRYIVEKIHGSDMLLNPHDRGIGTDLLLYGNREPLICKEYRKLLHEGMVVYDIGANIGYYALQEASIVGDIGCVYAIEPIPSNLKLLESNIYLNGYKNIKTYNLAVGDKDYKGFIKVSGMSNLSTMIDKSGYRQYKERLPVKVVSVDSFMKDKRLPDVIRMDTEGYEVNIIKGMTELFESKRPLILFIEVHFDMLKDEIQGMINTLKYYNFVVKVAAHETHPVIQDSWIRPLVNLCEKGIGASGYMDIDMDDLLTRECFLKGQVENMQVIFERGLRW